MSFKNIDYEEIYNEGHWENSEMYDLFTSRFLFVVYRNKGGRIGITNKNGETKIQDEYILEQAFFWTMPQDDLLQAFRYWVDIRKKVLYNKIELSSFWKIKDDKSFHVRPKGTKKSFKNAAINPNGGKCDKYCYWFNSSYVKGIVKKHYSDSV